jgi:hypothetical protein
MPSPNTPPSVHEAIPLRDNEKRTLRARAGWNTFLGSVPLPSLWVTAHVDLSRSRTTYGALEALQIDLRQCQSTDSSANSYRVFLQKFLTKLNWRLLQSKSHTRCFSFRGSLERNVNDQHGTELHYHFFLSAPNELFVDDPTLLDATARELRTLWLQKVNSTVSERHNPIHIQVIRAREDASRVAGYMNKDNPLVKSYELVDDWSTSRRR